MMVNADSLVRVSFDLIVALRVASVRCSLGSQTWLLRDGELITHLLSGSVHSVVPLSMDVHASLHASLLHTVASQTIGDEFINHFKRGLLSSVSATGLHISARRL